MEHTKRKQFDEEDIALAHRYRLSLTAAPRQSSFRVVAVVFYELLGEEENKRHHVVGTNDEPCYINGSICAERAALVQLRFLPLKRITKVVITTDAMHPIFPGMLCREFMISHLYIEPETLPIITAGSLCKRRDCGLDIGTCAGANACDMDKLMNGCTSTRTGKSFHDWESVRTSLPQLYPHPSPYTRLDASEAAKLGKLISMSLTEDNTSILLNETSDLLKEAKMLILEATKAAQIGNDRSELHPIQYGAAVLFDDGSIDTACQRKSLEYGCSLDAVTQLVVFIEKKNRGDGNSSAFSRPKILVQCDQFGVIHTPFATARAYLSEFHYEDCQVLVQKVIQDSNSSNGVSFDDDVAPKIQKMMSVSVKDISPSAPRMGDLWKE
jgi:cytidine deaminase